MPDTHLSNSCQSVHAFNASCFECQRERIHLHEEMVRRSSNYLSTLKWFGRRPLDSYHRHIFSSWKCVLSWIWLWIVNRIDHRSCQMFSFESIDRKCNETQSDSQYKQQRLNRNGRHVVSIHVLVHSERWTWSHSMCVTYTVYWTNELTTYNVLKFNGKSSQRNVYNGKENLNRCLFRMQKSMVRLVGR